MPDANTKAVGGGRCEVCTTIIECICDCDGRVARLGIGRDYLVVVVYWPVNEAIFQTGETHANFIYIY